MKQFIFKMFFLKATKSFLILIFFLSLGFSYSQSKNPFVIQADLNFKNEAYFDAIDLYKKGEVKEKDIEEKGRINFQIAECFRLDRIPKQAETYYKRAFKLKYQKNHPKLYILLADVLVEEGEYESAAENVKKYLEIFPDDKHAITLLSSCEHYQERIRKKTYHDINPVRQINSNHDDYSPTWYGTGNNRIVFVSSRNGSTGDGIDSRTGDNYTDLWESNIDNLGKWSEAQLLSKSINSKANEGSSVFSPTGDEIYFTRCPLVKKLDLGCAIFYSKRKGDSWTQAKEIKLKPEDADTLNCGHPAMDSAMKIMIFTSDFPGGYGMHDLWISEYDPREESWMKPVNLGPEINSTGDEMFPYLSENGDLYFSSDSYEGLGSLDIFKAKKLGENKWGNLENLGYPLNSFEDDYGIIFERNTDFEKGMFSSLRSPKDGQEGRPNIYNFKIPPLLIELMAEVTDSETGDPVPGATIKLTAIDTSGGIRNVFVETTDIDGIVHLKEISKGKRYIEHNLIYEVECQKDSFLVRKSKFSTFNLKPPGPKVEYVEFQVQPVSEKAIDFPEVQYALDKAELLVDTLDASLGQINSKDSLDFLYSTLIDNPTIVIELQAHTDCRGGDDYNQKLSQRRAQSCVDYLISKGIPAERMKAVGYGEAKPRMEGLECEAIADLSTSEEQEAAHQKNRRTQFIVLNFDYVPKDN